jgi:hypothetical protein
MQNKNPANPGGKEKLPGYPEDKNPAGTPDPRPEEFPGKAPDIYADRKSRDPKDSGSEKSQPERRDPNRENPDVNQARRKDESNPGRGDVERPGGDNRGREQANRGQQRQ